MLELGIQATTTFLSAAVAASSAAVATAATASAPNNAVSYGTAHNNVASNIDDNAFDNWSSDIVSANMNYAHNSSGSGSDSLTQLASTHAIIMNDTTVATALAAFVADYCNPLLYNSTMPGLDCATSITDINNNNNSLSSTAAAINNFYTYNSTNDTRRADNFSFILPWWRQVLWSVLFGGMVIVATGGNLIVVWIVMTTKRMRTVTNYFIVNLSIADAMVSSLNVTFNYIYMLDNNWIFGELYCKLSQFIAMLSICASVFTLMAIAIDRYVAIMKPLQPRMSKRSNLAIAAAIWLISTLLSCPMLLYFTTEIVYTNDGGQRMACFGNWPDGETNGSTQEFIYNILIMVLTYFLPIISMTVTYSRVGIELWGSKAIGEYTPRQVENVRSKRRVVKMMIVVVLIFAVCWLPFHTYFILTSCYPEITNMRFVQDVYLAIYWLAMSNSMYNPIIYCWMNSRFRFGFKMFFRWCPFVHVGAETLNRRDHMTSRYSCSGSPDHNRIKRNDTQKSILYACPSSPKSRRISHCGILRNATTLGGRDLIRHSAPITERSKVSYQQQQQLYHSNPQNNHELRGLSMCARTSVPKEGALSRQKWTTSLSLTVPPTMSMTAQQTSSLDESQMATETSTTTSSTTSTTATTNLMS